eukprot:scaffold21750_cov19-Tisochrysis_lutea.AAC.2
MRRKRIQLEHAREHDDAVVALKQKVGLTPETLSRELEPVHGCNDAMEALLQRQGVFFPRRLASVWVIPNH